MTHNLLFDVPKNKTRLELIKEKHGIQTHFTRGMGDNSDWVAVLMEPVWKLGYGVKHGDCIPMCFAHVGRLIDDYGLAGYGATEADAVLELCQENNIPCVL